SPASNCSQDGWPGHSHSHADSESDSKSVERDFSALISQIFATISVTLASQLKPFQHDRDSIFRKLFVRKKHEWLKYDKVEQIFVKTYAYSRIKKQLSYLLVGRKGSGKSTVTSSIHLSTDIYKENASINVDKIILERIFSWFDFKKFESDINHVITQVNFFEYAWEMFVYIVCMEVVVRESNKRSLQPEQAVMIPIVESFLDNIMRRKVRNHILDKASLYVFCMTSIAHYFDTLVKNARPEPQYFYTDISAGIQLDLILYNCIGHDVVSGFNQIIGYCQKKFLISMDGFDTIFDEFRRTTISLERKEPAIYEKRMMLEVDWLRSFLHVVCRMKSNHECSAFYDNIDFCITIPKDRFMEIMRMERDAYNYHGRYINLNWSGVELAILLRKRLEHVSNYFADKKGSPKERLDQIVAQKYSNIPQYVATFVGGREYKMPLFLYVLRHTFWRPRDILFYYWNIITTIDTLSAKKLPINDEAIRRIVADTTIQIINTEFINEFQTSLINVHEILDAFTKSCQELSFDDVSQLIGKMDFLFYDRLAPVTDIETKISFLYEIGFIGIRSTERTTKRFGVRSSHSFYFTENDDINVSYGVDALRTVKFLIHPIFCEFLQLDTTCNDELVLELTWEFIESNEAFNFAT
ncbi:hypothetical protein, partial [Azospirillum sp. TSO5]|uniref:P-loop ATPase, Sll1717 family n=1 Tax=Azospirillum sp. TSO5 TaxID=716760 RepID=UPI001304DCBF